MSKGWQLRPQYKRAYSWHQFFYVYGFLLGHTFALSLNAGVHARYFIEIIPVIFSLPVDEQVFLFINEVLTMILAHFKIGDELDSICRAGFFAVSAEDATGEIDAEGFRVPPAVLVF